MSFTRRPGSGCLRQTGLRENRYIVRNARVQPTASSVSIQAQVAPSLGAPVSSRTIQGAWMKDIWDNGTYYNQVAFSDESRCNLSSDDNLVCVGRPHGKRLNPAFDLQRLTTPTAGVMVWGAIAYNTRSPLVLISGTMTQPSDMPMTSNNHMCCHSHMQWLPGAIFQQDNARLQTARMSQDCLRTVTALTWPARSPDLSHIEHIWDHLGW
ncbi:transposable element Tcb2 transposase [Trichonephila clavipes]|nr:transposable element Tcb2 transposase [Trichonephila clavipes]